MSSLDTVWKIADAVLYEGYVLYPYRASAVKNRFRWQFGIVAPRAWSDTGGEPWQMRTECLIEGPQAAVDITVRFLQVEERTNPDGPPWETGVERRIETGRTALDELRRASRIVPFEIEAADGAISGRLCISSEAADGLSKLGVEIKNLSRLPIQCDRGMAMRRSLVGAHTLLMVDGGEFVSLTDPPVHARAAAQSCSNQHTWPVLTGPRGERRTMLSSPIILPDYPEVARESAGNLYDATEIDELLMLRIMTLTDEEKRQACATDDRAREIIERSNSIPREMFERLHGALRGVTAQGVTPELVEQFFNPASEEPERASIETASGRVERGARVKLAPKRRSDTIDMFLQGRMATVESVHTDVEDRVYVAVSVEGDDLASQRDYNRFYYFYPDEIELVEA
jgi:hypothetical protein